VTPEAKVKQRVRILLEAKGAWHFMPVSNGMGRHGIPDIIACYNGRFLAIECKAGKGHTTALQERELERINAANGIAIVVTDDPDTQSALIKLLENL